MANSTKTSITCSECYWCSLSHALSDQKVCCNNESEHYNQEFPKGEASKRGCNVGETQQAVDYRNMTAWQFASKYYM